MNEKKVRFLADQAGFQRGSGLLWKATEEQVAELIQITEMRTIVELINSMAAVHDAIAAQGVKSKNQYH